MLAKPGQAFFHGGELGEQFYLGVLAQQLHKAAGRQGLVFKQ
jgi:hypothetical protein